MTDIPIGVIEEGMTETEKMIAEYRYVNNITGDVNVSDMEFYFLMKDFE